MINSPIIALGQQPNGFFPKRFFYAKLQSARNLQKEIGGKIVLFYHDSDADYRETITVMRDKHTGAEVRLNFLQENKIQKNFSPLYEKRIPTTWKGDILKQLPRFFSPPSPLEGEGWGEGANMIELFTSVEPTNVADFCLEMYKKLGILDGIEVIKSSDKNFREAAEDLQNEFYADVPYEGEMVRAKKIPEGFQLHSGGDKFITLPDQQVNKNQKTPGRDHRFKWMNSVIHATHYITGNSEYDYLKKEDFPEVNFIKRDQIDDQELAWIPNL